MGGGGRGGGGELRRGVKEYCPLNFGRGSGFWRSDVCGEVFWWEEVLKGGCYGRTLAWRGLPWGLALVRRAPLPALRTDHGLSNIDYSPGCSPFAV